MLKSILVLIALTAAFIVCMILGQAFFKLGFADFIRVSCNPKSNLHLVFDKISDCTIFECP